MFQDTEFQKNSYIQRNKELRKASYISRKGKPKKFFIFQKMQLLR